MAHAVSHTGLEPQTGRSQTGLLLTVRALPWIGRSLDIVVAARDQPFAKLLRLLLEALPLARLRVPTVWVYHKGSPQARELAELRAATARLAELKLSLGLPNVGRAEHTC